MDIASELQQMEYLWSIIDAMGDMVRVITKEGRVAMANAAYDHGVNGKTLGQRCYEVFGQDGECETCISREVMQTGRPSQRTRYFNGKTFSITASPIKNDAGECLAVVQVARDMTLDYNIKQNLLRQNAKMKRDLHMARQLQQALVKNVLPVVEGYQLHSGFFPCEAVGGDIYDCMRFGNKLVLYIADVSGHGVMPAMLAVFFSRAVRTACSLGKLLPSDIFRYVQEEYRGLGMSDEVYITAFIVVLNVKTGAIAYSNAGLSVVPILYDGEYVRELYMSAQPISQWFDEPVFLDEYAKLVPGGRILLYSDGIRDLQSDLKVQYRLYDYFSQSGFECADFIGTVKRELHTRPEDDLTLLLLTREN